MSFSGGISGSMPGNDHDYRDQVDRLTSHKIADTYADNFRTITGFEAEYPSGISDETEFHVWLSKGKQLSLAAGNAVGEMHFAQSLGIDPQSLTCVDRNIPADIDKLEEAGVTYAHKDLVGWAKDAIIDRELKRDNTHYRVVTLFGAEYALEHASKEELAVFAAAVASSLDAGGVAMIMPMNENLHPSLAAAGLRRLSKAPQLYQKPPATI